MGKNHTRLIAILLPFFVIVFWLQLAQGCGQTENAVPAAETGSGEEDLRVDPSTGIPYAPVFQIPIQGFTTSDFGFGFGAENRNNCLERSGTECLEYGWHLGRDTVVAKSPVGTEVMAPADGIVRVTTNTLIGGYGADSKSNPAYHGCVLILEHEFPNGQALTSLLGHVRCEAGSPYSVSAKTGNPSVGTLVRRGQYVAHVGTFYHGPTDKINWSHLHWGMRKGRFSTTSGIAPYVRGYSKRTEFTADPVTGALKHPDWLDPFVIVAANGDPAVVAGVGVRFHPSGSMLQDRLGNYWLVTSATEIASIPFDVFVADRYDAHAVVRASDEEIGCYATALPRTSVGRTTLYKRPASSTVVLALDDRFERFDFVRWEALLSWGFSSSHISSDVAAATYREKAYSPKGLRLLRPGTLVKAEEESEVAIVTVKQTRLPIASADVFEALGFTWARVISVPKAVLSAVAGPRESSVLDWEAIHRCAVPKPCPGGGTCGGGGGGGGDLDAGVPDAGVKPAEICNGLDDDGNGLIDEIFECRLGATSGPPCTTPCTTSGQRICEAPTCIWGACKGFPENCSNTIDDDCNGLIDCLDPACTSSSDCKPKPDAGVPPTLSGPVKMTFSYVGPVAPGLIWIEGWWQPPKTAPRVWGKITACFDTISGDGKLNCSFLLPVGTSPFEFQVYLPDGRFWGDKSFDPKGGKGSTIGTVSLSSPTGALAITMVPNNSEGKPYYNGHIAFVP